jgi:hypothetical protein
MENNYSMLLYQKIDRITGFLDFFHCLVSGILCVMHHHQNHLESTRKLMFMLLQISIK